MGAFEKLLLIGGSALLFRAICRSNAVTDEEKQNKGANGMLLGGAIGLSLASLLDEEAHDTVNYTLKGKRKRVYHGITYEDRLDARIYEHEFSGKIFDEVIYDYPKPRSKAIELERKKIKRDRPKYNRHHVK